MSELPNDTFLTFEATARAINRSSIELLAMLKDRTLPQPIKLDGELVWLASDIANVIADIPATASAAAPWPFSALSA